MKIIQAKELKPGDIFVSTGETHVAMSVVVFEEHIEFRTLIGTFLVLKKETLVIKIGECET